MYEEILHILTKAESFLKDGGDTALNEAIKSIYAIAMSGDCTDIDKGTLILLNHIGLVFERDYFTLCMIMIVY